jgi:3-isopropylmalate/(R)-2-methylmalate dehydratase small subunit
MPEGARQSLASGNWDFLGQLLEGAAAVKQTTAQIPYLTGFRA